MKEFGFAINLHACSNYFLSLFRLACAVNNYLKVKKKKKMSALIKKYQIALNHTNIWISIPTEIKYNFKKWKTETSDTNGMK